MNRVWHEKGNIRPSCKIKARQTVLNTDILFGYQFNYFHLQTEKKYLLYAECVSHLFFFLCLSFCSIWDAVSLSLSNLSMFIMHKPFTLLINGWGWLINQRLLYKSFSNHAQFSFLCVFIRFRCGVWSKDDHYRWQTDQIADLGHGK